MTFSKLLDIRSSFSKNLAYVVRERIRKVHRAANGCRQHVIIDCKVLPVTREEVLIERSRDNSNGIRRL